MRSTSLLPAVTGPWRSLVFGMSGNSAATPTPSYGNSLCSSSYTEGVKGAAAVSCRPQTGRGDPAPILSFIFIYRSFIYAPRSHAIYLRTHHASNFSHGTGSSIRLRGSVRSRLVEHRSTIRQTACFWSPNIHVGGARQGTSGICRIQPLSTQPLPKEITISNGRRRRCGPPSIINLIATTVHLHKGDTKYERRFT